MEPLNEHEISEPRGMCESSCRGNFCACNLNSQRLMSWKCISGWSRPTWSSWSNWGDWLRTSWSKGKTEKKKPWTDYGNLFLVFLSATSVLKYIFFNKQVQFGLNLMPSLVEWIHQNSQHLKRMEQMWKCAKKNHLRPSFLSFSQHLVRVSVPSTLLIVLLALQKHSLFQVALKICKSCSILCKLCI